jgi:curved DNA-binding protein CbpA
MPAGPAFDPYAVLQVLPSADQEVVNAAFNALALKLGVSAA